MSINTEHKERLVNMFLRGQSVTDLSAFYAVQRVSVEDVIREAITQLATLAAANAPIASGSVAVDTNADHDDRFIYAIDTGDANE